MPKPTFFNLPPEKRNNLVQAALEEFAAKPYDQASLSRIVETVGIAKGSVYQYFDDKLELFSWLVEQAAKRKAEFFAANPPPAGIDVFERLRFMYLAGLRGWREAPLYSRLSLRALEPSTEPRLEAMRKQIQARGLAFIRSLLEEGRQRGEIRSDLDLEHVSHLVLGMLQEGLLRAFLAKRGLELHHLADEPNLAASLDDAHLRATVETAIAMLRGGLGTVPTPVRSRRSR